ncbi:DNA methyltransferase, partial [candidate division KSB1 bacterium]|nr:DNA methyltransferase [candidate division KSB1 bacterium]
GPEKDRIHPILYRPFDIRYTYYTGRSRGFQCMPRHEVMRHMLKENIGLITVRRVPPKNKPSYFLLTDKIISNGAIRSDNMSIDTLFPLYLYPKKEEKNPPRGSTVMMVFEPKATYGKKPNIAPEIFVKLSEAYQKSPSPEDILYYIYGVFYSSIYRETYAEFLKIDFPRVPFTADYGLFKKLVDLGKQIADLHLLKSPALDPPIAKYQGSGTNDRIDKITYQEDEQRIYINKDKYFEGINPEVWNYHIGGYQVLQKYLKDRKGRNMDDAPRYCRIVTALSQTIEIQEQIDKIYPEVEKELVRFKKA